MERRDALQDPGQTGNSLKSLGSYSANSHGPGTINKHRPCPVGKEFKSKKLPWKVQNLFLLILLVEKLGQKYMFSYLARPFWISYDNYKLQSLAQKFDILWDEMPAKSTSNPDSSVSMIIWEYVIRLKREPLCLYMSMALRLSGHRIRDLYTEIFPWAGYYFPFMCQLKWQLLREAFPNYPV